MRLIGKLSDEKTAQKFSSFLLKNKIENHYEPAQDSESKENIYAIWVYDEDQVDNAYRFWDEFAKNPNDPKFDVPYTPPPPPPETLEESSKPKNIEEAPTPPKIHFRFTITGLFLILCVFVYFLNTAQEMRLKKQYPKLGTYLLTPIQYALLYDLPKPLEKLKEVTLKEKTPITHEVLEATLETKTMWRGMYWWIIEKFSRKPPEGLQAIGPVFVKLRQGQIWRLFTPCILHRDFLHILFNMIWLWILGKQIDIRLNKWKFLLFVVITGIVSNTAQYLMSGPLFLGFSGVIAAMAGFIWIRQKQAPWEGYSIHRSTFIFLACFILLMLLIQIILFGMMMLGLSEIDFNIANTAHISGVLIGMLLGKMSFFSWRPN